MSTLAMIAVVVAVLGLLFFVLNKTAFRRTIESGKAQVGKAGRWAWKKDPAAIYQQRIDDATEEIKEATKAVEEHKGLVNSLGRQVADGEKECAVLDARIKGVLATDENDSKGLAAGHALKLERAEENLKRNKEQHAKASVLYQNNIRKIQLARQKIKDAEEEGRQLGIELKMAKTNAAISDLAAKTNITITSVDGLGEVAEEMRRQIDKENAKGDVAADLGTDGMEEVEAEESLRKAKAVDILARYKNK